MNTVKKNKLFQIFNSINRSIDIYLFVFLAINPILSIIESVNPSLISILPNFSIIFIRLILISIPIIRNIKSFNKMSAYVLIFLAIAVMISSTNENNLNMIVNTFVNGENICLFFLFFYFSEKRDYSIVLNTYYYLTYVILIAGIICVATGFYGEWSQFRYMEFSHSMIIYWTFITYFSFKHKRKIDCFFMIFTGIIIALLSNRSIIINIVLAFLIYANLYLTRNRKIKINILFGSTVAFILLFFNQFKNIVSQFLTLFNVNSYSLITLELGDFFASSSRMEIWSNCFKLINAHPILGNGICADRVMNGNVGSYAHNIVIELWVDFGVIFGTIVFVGIIYLFYNVLSKSQLIVKELILPFVLVSTLILMLSKSIYILPEFWVALGIACQCSSDKFISKIKHISFFRKREKGTK